MIHEFLGLGMLSVALVTAYLSSDWLAEEPRGRGRML
jgi:hypothetical protein